MAKQGVADPALVGEGLAYWAEKLSVPREQLELAVAAWRAAQDDAEHREQ